MSKEIFEVNFDKVAPEDCEWKNMGIVVPEKGDFYYDGSWLQRTDDRIKMPSSYPTMRLVKIRKSTTLKDLVGDDGQKQLWIHHKDYNTVLASIYITVGGYIKINGVDSNRLAEGTSRWSHSPFTKYEDANEFIK